MIEQIFLIGYRATGKTTIGRKLAEKLDFEFVDTDHLICQDANSTVQHIVEKNGWDAFREYEARALVRASHGEKRIVATGGGAVLHHGAWGNICSKAFVVWLFADSSTLAERMLTAAGTDPSRPSLTGKSINEEIDQVMSERAELYELYSDLKIDTAHLSTSEAVDIIIESFRSRGDGSK